MIQQHKYNNNNDEENISIDDENIILENLRKKNLLSVFFDVEEDNNNKHVFCSNDHELKKANKKIYEIEENNKDSNNIMFELNNNNNCDKIHHIKPKNIIQLEQIMHSSENNSSMGYQQSTFSHQCDDHDIEMFQEWMSDIYQKICNEEEEKNESYDQQNFEKKEIKRNKKEKKFHEESLIWIQKMNANQRNGFITFLSNIEKRMIIPNYEFSNEHYFFLNDLFLETDIFCNNNKHVKKWFILLETYRLFTLCIDMETYDLFSHIVLFDMCLEKAIKKITKIYNQKKELTCENIKKEKILSSSIKNMESLMKQDFEKKTNLFNEKICELKQKQKEEKEEFERHQKMEYDQFEQEIKIKLKLENIQEEIQNYENKKKEECNKNEIVLSLF